MRIYISGKISGTDFNKTRTIFYYHQRLISEAGHTPVNPFNVSPEHPEKTWEQYMIDDIAELFKCDAIYMIKGWGDSRGARIEYAIAREMGLKVFFSGTDIMGRFK